ncbi:putative Capsule biosynthesis protein CapA [Desulfamplus magnetovallimortis]|uniref:Putative Capsule biosynthesis protein CapA n=1 Tax=Desulfamplus magnetovallimortis TaxID=1246637 RepID=A0A1W1H8A7_9BACT|nr:CapA family protein [Desulfamplus magnetovallimortis]SLM28701.1 putative Capsule biosynthesis protein CapA [Desulfamplus magnetovallimortis]
MNIIITGDFFISDEFKNKPLIDKSVIDFFQAADCRIVNLEAPLTSENPKNKILKSGPHLRMSEDAVMPFLKQLKVYGVTLANNHILDYGAKGLADTFAALKRNNIHYVGGGNNLAEANKPLTIEQDGMKVAILNFCENEWSIAEDDKPGANPMDIIDNTNQIKAAKATHDKVISIIHGGHEYYHLPSPRMVKQYRFYADNGADAIVGHHTHCIGGYEIYNEVPIIYSLGNFIFTRENKNPLWYSGLVAKLNLKPNKPIQFTLKATSQTPINYNLSLKEDEKNIFNDIKNFNRIIQDKELLAKEWHTFITSREKNYHKKLSPMSVLTNRYLKYVFYKFIFNQLYLNNNYLATFLNILRCEAHSDALIYTIRRLLYNK